MVGVRRLRWSSTLSTSALAAEFRCTGRAIGRCRRKLSKSLLPRTRRRWRWRQAEGVLPLHRAAQIRPLERDRPARLRPVFAGRAGDGKHDRLPPLQGAAKSDAPLDVIVFLAVGRLREPRDEIAEAGTTGPGRDRRLMSCAAPTTGSIFDVFPLPCGAVRWAWREGQSGRVGWSLYLLVVLQ
jgi:hypothetical protein